MREGKLALENVPSARALEPLVADVFADPEVRRGMGWTEADDTDEAMEAIHGLWARRFEEGWELYEVRHDGRRAGLAGLGPLDEDGTAWYAIYLLERGEGLGRAVSQRLVERARDAGARSLIAVTWAVNEASRRLMEAIGFELEGPAPYAWARDSELDWVQYRLPIGPAGT